MSRPEFYTEAGIDRRIKEGRGQGHGPNYQSWLRITDFSSTGFRMALYSAKLGRIVHLLSFLELCVFLYAEYNPRFVDIRENYPLNRERTQQIAREKGYRHPNYKGVDIIVATDLYITEEVAPGMFQYHAWSTKAEKEREFWRTEQKIEIEAIYHLSGKDTVKFDVMCKEKLPPNLVDNLRFVRGTLRPDAMIAYTRKQIRAVDDFMRPRITELPMEELSDQFAAKNAWARESGVMDIARYLIATRRWPVDLTVPIKIGQPLTLLQPT